jgi:hypothetical protein
MKTFRIIIALLLLLSAMMVFVFQFMGGLIQLLDVSILNSIQYGVLWVLNYTPGIWLFIWFILLNFIPYILPRSWTEEQPVVTMY